jgi:hypothetical protein
LKLIQLTIQARHSLHVRGSQKWLQCTWSHTYSIITMKPAIRNTSLSSCATHIRQASTDEVRFIHTLVMALQFNRSLLRMIHTVGMLMLQVRNLGTECTLAAQQHISFCLKHVPKFNQSSFNSNCTTFGSTFFPRIFLLTWVTLDVNVNFGMNPCIWILPKTIFPNCELTMSTAIVQIKLQNANTHHISLNHFTLVTLACWAIQTHFWRPTLLLIKKPKGLKYVKSITFLMTSISLLTIDTILLFHITLLTVIKQQWNKQTILSPYSKW